MANLWEKTKAFARTLYRKAKGMNPFVLAGILFVLYLLLPPFSGEYSLWNQTKTSRRLSETRAEYDKLSREIEVSRKDLEELRYRKDMLEKYAREKFLMKADDEDLYLLK